MCHDLTFIESLARRVSSARFARRYVERLRRTGALRRRTAAPLRGAVYWLQRRSAPLRGAYGA